ncbi:unnamed protein product [Gongylonema pulchrum]|uniref:histone acetyltransferase n=1 Tax=Gongylonema pulchrum TaxID=637853 RepID=A0A3P7P2I5_9BILA|nr:unnamed protein product [Gongylonema pulchrum]
MKPVLDKLLSMRASMPFKSRLRSKNPEKQLSQVFVEQINPVMKKLGYCCGQKLSFTPPSLYCDGNSLCTIARDQYYHVYEAT